MKRIAFLLVAVVTLAALMAGTSPSSGHADEQAASVAAGKLPSGYRDWRLISVAREEGVLDDVRAILGNDVTRFSQGHSARLAPRLPGIGSFFTLWTL